MKKTIFASIAAAGLVLSADAFAAALVIGDGPATACYEAARADRADITALRVCNQALDETALSRADTVATNINRGIILVNRRDAAAALRDFDRAIEMSPAAGEAFVNRGAALLLLGRYDEAVESLNRGIELNTTELHKAYFNRALAQEELGNTRAAYEDYNRAAELAPEWDIPRRELARFTVTRR